MDKASKADEGVARMLNVSSSLDGLGLAGTQYDVTDVCLGNITTGKLEGSSSAILGEGKFQSLKLISA